MAMMHDWALSAAEAGLGAALRGIDRLEQARQDLHHVLVAARATVAGLRGFVMLRRMPDDPEEAVAFFAKMAGVDPEQIIGSHYR